MGTLPILIVKFHQERSPERDFPPKTGKKLKTKWFTACRGRSCAYPDLSLLTCAYPDLSLLYPDLSLP